MVKLGLVPLLFAALPAFASPITYSVNQVGPTASAVGSITTDGTLGSLAAQNILDFNFSVSIAAQSYTYYGTTIVTPAKADDFTDGSTFFFGAPPLTATASGLFYNFGDTADVFADFSSSADENAPSSNVCLSGGVCSGGDQGFQGLAVFVNGAYSEVVPLAGNEEFATVTNAAAVTPEPSSLLLLVTGAMGGLGILCRRSRSSATG